MGSERSSDPVPVEGKKRTTSFPRTGPRASGPGQRMARQLHRAGPHTLAVSLPKSWVDRNSLSRGSAVWLIPREDGGLELDPVSAGERGRSRDRVLRVEVDHFSEPEVLARTIFGGYVVGYDQMEVSDRKGFDKERQKEVARVARSLVGLQVVFTDAHRITLQSFLDPRRHTIPQVLGRAALVINEMAQLLSTSILKGTAVPVEELGEMEAEADRLYALTLRQLMLAHQDPALAGLLDVSEPRDLLGSRVVGKVVEDIADLLVRAGSALRAGLQGKEIPPRLRADLASHVEALRTMVADSSRALLKEDSALAHRVLRLRDGAPSALHQTELFLARARLPRRQTASLAMFAWGLGTARHLCGTIAEVALNQSIRSTGGAGPRSDRAP
jgi:phosphate uptake regulator